MKDHICKRAQDIGNHILATQATVRDTARRFGVSKSTVHKDVTERLPRIDPVLASQVRAILERNKMERHIRGGEATRRKFLNRSR